jgi:GLPGLI family protein
MKKNNRLQYLFVLLSVCITFCSNAQSVINSGTIVFEKKVNLHKKFEGVNDERAEMMKKFMPKHKITNFDLQFNNNISVWTKSAKQPAEGPSQGMRPPRGGGGPGGPGGFGGGMMFRGGGDDDDKNMIYKLIAQDSIYSSKAVFEKTMLLKDSLPKMKWTITNEFRKIANINCRRATTIVMDSIYVIAFYADEINCSSGPESFHGLPGMILGLVIPRINTTYFATSVIASDFNALTERPTKGEAHTYKTLFEVLNNAGSGWGKKWKNGMVWQFML